MDLETANQARIEAESQAQAATNQVAALQQRITELSQQLEAANKKQQEALDLSTSSYMAGEEAMRSRIAEAWALGPHESAPFSYFERRLKYVESVQVARVLEEELPPPYESDEEDEDEEVEEAEDPSSDAGPSTAADN